MLALHRGLVTAAGCCIHFGPLRVIDHGERPALSLRFTLGQDPQVGDLGADIIKVEPPGGDSGRRSGPFYRDEEDPNNSLSYWAYNTNKRSIILDLETREDRQT